MNAMQRNLLDRHRARILERGMPTEEQAQIITRALNLATSYPVQLAFINGESTVTLPIEAFISLRRQLNLPNIYPGESLVDPEVI